MVQGAWDWIWKSGDELLCCRMAVSWPLTIAGHRLLLDKLTGYRPLHKVHAHLLF